MKAKTLVIYVKYHFECCSCGKKYYNQKFMYLCSECEQTNTNDSPPKGVLKTLYEYKKLSSDFLLFEKNNYLDLLPIENKASFPKLKIGQTPLYQYNEFNHEKLKFSLYLKDDSQNPTFSFKDRAYSFVSAYAKENNIKTIVTASTGNAGSSLAGICASQNQKAIIYVPKSAPKAKLIQIKMYGAELRTVDGTYDKAFDLSIEASNKNGWFNRNTAYNPFTIEGKKVVSFEIFSQLDYKIPDNIFVPVGDGVIISGVFKGFYYYYSRHTISKMPNIIAVQSENSRNIIANINKSTFVSEKSCTIADSISVDIPRNFYLCKNYIKKYQTDFLTVSDKYIIEASFFK